MKKSLLLISVFFTFLLCNAQVKTYSNYDVNGDGKVSVADVTKTVNRVIEKVSDDRTFVDGESLNALLMSIDARLKAIEEKLEISTSNTPDDSDPYNGHEYVDLGLHSGLKWATCNVGANSPEEYGDYFAWGATESQNVYTYVYAPYQTQYTTNSSSARFTKYLGSTSSSYKDSSALDADAVKTFLDLEDDAAHVNWGGCWHMPTRTDWSELCNNCYWMWVTTYNGKSANGYIVYKVKDLSDKGKYSSTYTPIGSYSVSDPHIFLPAAGYRVFSSLFNDGKYGSYWSSSLISTDPYDACCLFMNSGSVGMSNDGRYCGQSVRAVCRP